MIHFMACARSPTQLILLCVVLFLFLAKSSLKISRPYSSANWSYFTTGTIQKRRGAAIAQWIRLPLPSCRLGFSLKHNICASSFKVNFFVLHLSRTFKIGRIGKLASLPMLAEGFVQVWIGQVSYVYPNRAIFNWLVWALSTDFWTILFHWPIL